MSGTLGESILSLARDLKLLRPKDLTSRGIPHQYLRRLVARGDLQRLSRGVYALPDLPLTETTSLAEACKRVPGGVVCLLSALRFHELGTQDPFEVWLAIHPKAWRPRADDLPLRIVRFSGAALDEGVEEHQAPEGSIRVYSPAKTVVDCFRYRNKIGLDVGLEALREYQRDRRGSMDDIWRYAKLLRAARVMRPYLEAIAV
jgi:predicted transcriptional regulator of viral defense system